MLAGKIGSDREAIDDYPTLLRSIASVAPSPPATESITGDPADDTVLACAVGERAEILVTGDRRHLLPVGRHRGVRILTPQALLAELADPG